jgi:hypothetical protein
VQHRSRLCRITPVHAAPLPSVLSCSRMCRFAAVCSAPLPSGPFRSRLRLFSPDCAPPLPSVPFRFCLCRCALVCAEKLCVLTVFRLHISKPLCCALPCIRRQRVCTLPGTSMYRRTYPEIQPDMPALHREL